MNMKNNYTNNNTDIVELVFEDQNDHTGWICPRCGKSVSPDYKICPYCSNQQTDENLNPNEQIIYG